MFHSKEKLAPHFSNTRYLVGTIVPYTTEELTALSTALFSADQLLETRENPEERLELLSKLLRAAFDSIEDSPHLQSLASKRLLQNPRQELYRILELDIEATFEDRGDQTAEHMAAKIASLETQLAESQQARAILDELTANHQQETAEQLRLAELYRQQASAKAAELQEPLEATQVTKDTLGMH